VTGSLASLLFDSEIGVDTDLVHVAGASRTRGQIEQRAVDLADALRRLGVERGQPVAVMLPNGPDVVAALFGVWRAGAVQVPINPRLTPTEVDRLLESVPPAAIVTTSERSGSFGERPLVLAADEGWQTGDGRAVAVAHHDADVALIQFTSGTTGPPKPVLLLHSGVLALLDGVIRKLRSGSSRSGPPMPNLVPVSLSLWAGIYNVLFALRVGAPIVILEQFDTRTFVEAVRRFGIRSTVLPPAAMTMLADDDAVTDLEPLRFVRSITAPLSPLQARRFKDRFGISVLNSYGQTEIGGEVIGWNAADSRSFGESKLGSVGRPHEGVEVRIVDDDGTTVPVEETGELWVRTPALSGGYADGNPLGDRVTADGWFRTGDHARVDAGGFVWIEGRVSDMVNRGGLKVFPAEVEEVLRLDGDVADVAVTGVPDDRLGEIPWAFVVARTGRLDVDRLDALCRQHLAPFKVPAGFSLIDALPRNDIGKVLRKELARSVERAAPERSPR
jgi:long-chain acyl-CoA synthetase